jgi:hypothetical protein
MTAKIVAKLAEPHINAQMLIAKTDDGYITKVVPGEGENPASYAWADWINHPRREVKQMLVNHFGVSEAEAERILSK